MTEDQIQHMTYRFLMWKLPKPFRPDNRINFDPPAPLNSGTPYENDLWPTGTNLFDAGQAEAIVRHMVEGMPAEVREIGSNDAPDEDWFEEVIGDSLDMDWTARDGARAIVRRWPERWYKDGAPTHD